MSVAGIIVKMLDITMNTLNCVDVALKMLAVMVNRVYTLNDSNLKQNEIFVALFVFAAGLSFWITFRKF